MPGRVRVKEKLGINADRPIDPRSGAIAPQVADPAIIADIGVGWVRLNFVLGEPWSGPMIRIDRWGEPGPRPTKGSSMVSATVGSGSMA